MEVNEKFCVMPRPATLHNRTGESPAVSNSMETTPLPHSRRPSSRGHTGFIAPAPLIIFDSSTVFRYRLIIDVHRLTYLVLA